jgi:cell division protein FtsQ
VADRKRRGSPFSRKHGPRTVQGEVLLDDRQRRRLTRIRWRRIGLVLASLGAFAGVVALYFSPALRVQNVEVTTGPSVDGAEIRELAGLHGDSLLTADLAAAEQSIEELPMVKDATISRSWPQTVRITVVERTPWAVWQAGSTSYVVDDEGFVLPVEASAGAPVINVGGEPADLQPGDRVDSDAVALARSLTQQVPAELALNISAFEWTDASGLTITTDAGYRVVLGDSQNMDYKLAVWRAVEADLGRDAMSGHVLDLRFGDRPSFQ